ncbi:hypothetical protein KKA87_10405 [bacterium]|nr:hypothetical protein [bacterium]MBU1874299.1 hypothetical protein [bacterium]
MAQECKECAEYLILIEDNRNYIGVKNKIRYIPQILMLYGYAIEVLIKAKLIEQKLLNYDKNGKLNSCAMGKINLHNCKQLLEKTGSIVKLDKKEETLLKNIQYFTELGKYPFMKCAANIEIEKERDRIKIIGITPPDDEVIEIIRRLYNKIYIEFKIKI